MQKQFPSKESAFWTFQNRSRRKKFFEKIYRKISQVRALDRRDATRRRAALRLAHDALQWRVQQPCQRPRSSISSQSCAIVGERHFEKNSQVPALDRRDATRRRAALRLAHDALQWRVQQPYRTLSSSISSQSCAIVGERHLCEKRPTPKKRPSP